MTEGLSNWLNLCIIIIAKIIIVLPSSDSNDDDKDSLPSLDDLINSETHVTEAQSHSPPSEPFCSYSTSVDK